MERLTRLTPLYTQYMPEKELMQHGVLYVSMEFGSIIHLCACGCGEQVVTPIGKTWWKLAYDGEVSLEPSIGSWQLPCKSHYYITKNNVIWC